MNKEEILAMEAGVELDAEVAEKIFGWSDLYGRTGEYFHEESGRMLRSHIRPYSADISAAWEVFEKNGVMGIVGYMGADECYCVLHSGFHIESGVGQEVHATGKTIPEAICKAALLAVIAL